MINLKPMISVSMIATVILLNACSSDSSTTATEVITPAETVLKIFAESSQSSAEAIDATGVWLSDCYVYQNTSAIDQIRITEDADGATISAVQFVYVEPGDTICALSLTTVFVMNTTAITANGTKAITGWVDNAGVSTVPPTRVDGAGQLTGQPSVSMLEITSDLNSLPTKDIFYIDDTAIPWVMYRSGKTTGADEYPDTLIAVYKLIKQ